VSAFTPAGCLGIYTSYDEVNVNHLCHSDDSHCDNDYYCWPPEIRGDPQFVGLRGQSFQVHGIDGAVYNLISDVDIQLNSRFVFLSGPRDCPHDENGKLFTTCFSHAGSYLGEIGLLYKNRRVYIASGTAAHGFANVTVEGRQMRVGDFNDLISFNSSHHAILTFGHWSIRIDNSDGFLNVRRLGYSLPMSRLKSHGLIGQTYDNKRYPSTLKVIEGEVDDYSIGDDQLFGTDFVFNKYEQQQ